MESSIRQKMIDESFYKMANNLPILIHEILIKSAGGEYIENNIKKIVDAEIEATSNYLKKIKNYDLRLAIIVLDITCEAILLKRLIEVEVKDLVIFLVLRQTLLSRILSKNE